MTSVSARNRMYWPVFAVNSTSFSAAVFGNVPVATAVPQVTPSMLT